ncbi:hypothetical protein FH508_0017835 [Lysinibacillus sp. CD3-6]|uniref:hypothetical protein n=1 Tax=Lysinibacillus sp. CD3-6 TaxID=2892541 RepID=UPI00116F196A|nr:hypothetical protein [Lysinibacillus sp. CD3-6]UED79291.1 hypothetical protein FH508_0017835 [Lysinibacillus sp. CD3-6]
MLSFDKKTFFKQRQLPLKNFYYSYNGQNYTIALDKVIGNIGCSEEKSLFLLNELKATDDFIVNVYLQDLADEHMQRLLRQSFCEEIESSLLDKQESYRFTLTKKDGIYEYIAYQDEEGKYHVNRVEYVGRYVGRGFSKFSDKLYSLLGSHTFDCKRIEKPEEVND